LRGGSDALGLTRDLAVTGGDRDVELRLDPIQRVFLTLSWPESERPNPAIGSVRYSLILADGRTSSGHGNLDGFTLEHVPVGLHRLVVFTWAPEHFGELELPVVEGSDLHGDVRLRRSRRAHGRVVDVDGLPLSGVRVSLVDAPWPALESEDPCLGRTDLAGRFDVLLADRAEAVLDLSYEGRESLRVQVEAGRSVTWTLP
jgi:hypothetical protein